MLDLAHHPTGPTSLKSKAATLVQNKVAPTRTSTTQRWTVDGEETIGYPLVPVGDQTHFEPGEDGLEQVSYPAIGLRIVYPNPTGKLPSSAIVDVYTGLMFLYAAADFPEDGKLYFSRYQLLHLIGWFARGNGARNVRTVKPSGRHYWQLKAALNYLQGTRFFRETHGNATLIGYDGERFRGADGYPILQYWRVVDEPTGPKSDEAPLSARSMVHFSEPFVAELAGGRRVAWMDLELFFSLSAGTPRLLYRTLTWMRTRGVRELPVQEVFQRLGSVQRLYVPSRAEQMLGKAHAELRAHGVLATDPQYEKREGGKWWVRYEFGDPRVLRAEEEVLVRQAEAYGVSIGTARELVVAHREQFEEVLAATTLGLIRPKVSLPRMIVHYTRHGYKISATTGAREFQMSLDLGTPECRYLAWTKEERARRLARSHVIDAEKIRDELLATDQARGIMRPRWVIDGLVAIRLNALLGIEAFESWQQTHEHALATS